MLKFTQNGKGVTIIHLSVQNVNNIQYTQANSNKHTHTHTCRLGSWVGVAVWDQATWVSSVSDEFTLRRKFTEGWAPVERNHDFSVNWKSI